MAVALDAVAIDQIGVGTATNSLVNPAAGATCLTAMLALSAASASTAPTNIVMTWGISATATIAATVLNVTAVLAGPSTISVGQAVIGTGVTLGTTILSLGTGTGGTGTYNLSQSSTVSVSETMGIGQLMTKLSDSGWYVTGGNKNVQSILFGLASPNITGSTQSANAAWTNSVASYTFACSWTGSDTTNPFNNSNTVQTPSQTPSTLGVSSATNDQALFVWTTRGASINSVTGGTQLWVDNGGSQGNGGSNYVAGAGTSTSTLNLSGADFAAGAGINIRIPFTPAASANHFLSMMGVGTTILFGMLSSLSNFFFGKADKQWA